MDRTPEYLVPLHSAIRVATLEFPKETDPPTDRRCRPGCLNHPLRRWLAPPRRDLDFLELRPGETVADIGAGVGFHVPEILQRIGPGGTLIAVDPDEQNLELLRARAGAFPASTRLTVVAVTASRLGGILTGSLDAILMSLVLCCLVDKTGALEEAWRVLRPGGRILVTFPRFGGFRPAAKRALRVSEELWKSVRSLRPWEEPTSLPGRLINRHRLWKPLAS